MGVISLSCLSWINGQELLIDTYCLFNGAIDMAIESYDVIVIGAGIQGVAVAQAASAKGYRVLLLEQYEKTAQGTSSRSSKLIHGGLRYLETGQFSLVYECLTERKYLLHNAPHLVKLVPFYIPVYEDSYRGPWKIALGLSLYSLLSFTRFERVPRQKWSSLDGIKQQGLKAVFKYYDGQTDDAALTRAVLASAKTMGAEIQFSVNIKSVVVEKNKCAVIYQHNKQQKSVSSTTVVNASGPWVASFLARISPIQYAQPEVELVQGTHIIIKDKGKQGIYYLEAPQDKRAVFVMPWQGRLLIGTTENSYQGDPAEVKPLTAEIDYLLTVYNHYFATDLDQEAVLSAFAGLRVLPKTNTKAFSRPRDTLVIASDENNPRLLSLYGGKLTAYRATAERVMAKLSRVLPKATEAVDTRDVTLL